MRLNGAELILPVALAACAGLARRSLLRLLFPLVPAILLAAQPDVSQAVAWAGASVVLLITADRPAAWRLLVAAGVAAGAVVAGLRPDPLSPVPEVEGVIALAAAVSPALAAVAVAAVGAAALAPLRLATSRDDSVRDAAFSLVTYLVLTTLAPLAGAFPVPFAGMAVSGIFGGWLGVGWLVSLAARAQRA